MFNLWGASFSIFQGFGFACLDLFGLFWINIFSLWFAFQAVFATHFRWLLLQIQRVPRLKTYQACKVHTVGGVNLGGLHVPHNRSFKHLFQVRSRIKPVFYFFPHVAEVLIQSRDMPPGTLQWWSGCRVSSRLVIWFVSLGFQRRFFFFNIF